MGDGHGLSSGSKSPKLSVGGGCLMGSWSEGDGVMGVRMGAWYQACKC
jgi:hypothetical protein